MIRLRRLVAARFKQLDHVDLELPERARILVKGLNEAGKSTLFEAVFFGLFGQGLGGQGARNLDELIRYGADDAQVDLWVGLTDGRSLEIRRRLRRGKPNLWELDLLAADGSVEETIRGNREVNQRIAAELGFDAEALLNTCFVEQKKLDKLEGMNRAEREQSLMRLLNLDRLLDLADQLKVRLADRQELARLADRRQLALCQEELPDAQARTQALAGSLARLEAWEALEGQRVQAERLRGLGGDLVEARKTEASLAEQARRAQALAEARAALAEARQAARQAAELRAQAARVRSAAERARQAGEVEIPAVTARGLGLRRLARRRQALSAWSAEAERLAADIARRDAELASLAEDLAVLNRVRQDWVEARAEAREALGVSAALEQDRRAFEVRQALGDWLEAGEALDRAAPRAPDGALAALLTEAEDLGRRQARLRGLAAAAGVLAALGGGLLAFGPGGALAWTPLLLGALLLLGLGLAWASGQGRRTTLALEQGRLEGEAAVHRQALEQRRAALATAEARLQAAQAVRPATPERGRQAMAEIEARLGERTREAVEAALAEAGRRQARAQEAGARLEAREAELKARVQGRDGATLGAERDAWERRLARLRAALARRLPRLAAQAAALGLADEGDPLAAAGLDEELGALRARLAELRRLAAERGPLEAEAGGIEERAAGLAAASAAAWRRAGGAGADLASPMDFGSQADRSSPEDRAGPEDRATLADAAGSDDTTDGASPRQGSTAPPPADDPAWDRAATALAAAYEAAGGDALRERLQAAARVSATALGQLQAEERGFLDAWTRLGGVLKAAGLPPAPALTPEPTPGVGRGAGAEAAGGARLAPEAIEAALAAVATTLPPPEGRDRTGLQADLEAARGRLQVLRHDRARLEAELGLAGQTLDRAEAEARLAEAEESLALRDRAARMVEQAGRRVMQGILPGTLLHMQRILPVLTEQRYLEARLTEDLQIEVYDERAANWRKKPIFSGGAKDQFSLALRLAFAMATLPEERGAAPGFLFLDEPLGAFDSRRAEALIDLLCQGEVAGAFDQIFLISHIPVDEDRFDRTVALEGGRVVKGAVGSSADLGADDLT